ncbi:zinc finger MYM-type protein 1-like [Gordionus sp. m RMFG-2023]|uniref:zinc finger MYM-type protein 1-like n=1 Tax=Gordionus sp. m RMFG-2023 TaxID=3053472 RepID=UPI0031FC42A9
MNVCNKNYVRYKDKRWTWLAFSPTINGAFCKNCVLFGPKFAGRAQQKLQSLVLTPFAKWKDDTETFNNHQNNKYHINAEQTIYSLRSIKNGESMDTIRIIDTGKQELVLQNRSRLTPIIDAILVCGIQGIALRGHRDSGAIYDNDNNNNDGNLRAILRNRSLGDPILRDNLLNCPKNATYLSPIIQNEIIYACNELILKKIITNINKSPYFSVLADETTDVSGVEQMSLCVRYISLDGDIQILEEFLQFIPVMDMRGEALAKTILLNLEKYKLNLNLMRGQDYDGAPAMSGHLNGVKAHILKKYPFAIYVHCASHSLNLAISDSCALPSIRNSMAIISKIYDFFKYPKRSDVLNRTISMNAPETHHQKLKKMCPTGWVYVMIQFRHL